MVVGVEARGFPLATLMANKLGKPMVMARKPSKLPGERVKVEYELEYGTDALEMHDDAVRKGQRVLVVDDLLATGGTAKAVVELLTGRGAEVHALAFLIELEFLPGREKLGGQTIHSVVRY